MVIQKNSEFDQIRRLLPIIMSARVCSQIYIELAEVSLTPTWGVPQSATFEHHRRGWGHADRVGDVPFGAYYVHPKEDCRHFLVITTPWAVGNVKSFQMFRDELELRQCYRPECMVSP
ncbi:hypothetical protein T08_14094 [Trichinella sp. T8]|nr:hypothetical protein T08_14094 [Trichinella sp. T8]